MLLVYFHALNSELQIWVKHQFMIIMKLLLLLVAGAFLSGKRVNSDQPVIDSYSSESIVVEENGSIS